MGKSTTKAKNKYNAKAYDRAIISFKKGEKDAVSAYAAGKGLSLNGYIMELIKADMEKNK